MDVNRLAQPNKIEIVCTLHHQNRNWRRGLQHRAYVMSLQSVCTLNKPLLSAARELQHLVDAPSLPLFCRMSLAF